MKQIRMEHGQVVYFGNVIGYVTGKTAVVDLMFQREDLQVFLGEEKEIECVDWVDGVYERLLQHPGEAVRAQPIRKCRVWQLKPNVDLYMKFIDYDKMLERFGEPKQDWYTVVYDGEVDAYDLEHLYEKFKGEPLPNGFTGHALTLSDVLELYNEKERACFYVDMYTFRKISFGGEAGEDVSA